MADIADRAQVTEELHQRLVMETMQRRMAASQELETADNCCECGGMIPSARQAAVPGTQHCVTCAGKLEMQARGCRSAA
jgi:RNA polymerase-binding transcription factor DksA